MADTNAGADLEITNTYHPFYNPLYNPKPIVVSP
jgi:ABC-type cobalt transport system substrate-binding protein